MGKISNISLSAYKRYLIHCGCVYKRTSGGHDNYSCPGVIRPITLQNHVDPVPQPIIQQHLRAMGKSREDLLEFLGID